jgi:hypothetical protein
MSYFPRFFYFDDMGYSGWSMNANSSQYKNVDLGVAEDYYAKSVYPLILSKISKYAQPAASLASIGAGYILVLLQVQNDSVLKLARFDSFEMVKMILNVGLIRNIKVVLKFHPRLFTTNLFFCFLIIILKILCTLCFNIIKKILNLIIIKTLLIYLQF